MAYRLWTCKSFLCPPTPSSTPPLLLHIMPHVPHLSQRSGHPCPSSAPTGQPTENSQDDKGE